LLVIPSLLHRYGTDAGDASTPHESRGEKLYWGIWITAALKQTHNEKNVFYPQPIPFQETSIQNNRHRIPPPHIYLNGYQHLYGRETYCAFWLSVEAP